MEYLPPRQAQQEEYYHLPQSYHGRSVDGWDPIAATPDLDSAATPPQPSPASTLTDLQRPSPVSVGLGIGHGGRSPSGYDPIYSHAPDDPPDSRPQFVDAPSKTTYQPQQYLFTIPETPIHHPPQYDSSSDSPEKPRSSPWREWSWFRSPGPMYAAFCLGIIFAGSHHAFYSSLDGKPADDQIRMMRMGGLLSYAAKASLVSSVIFAYRQQVWVTARRKRLRLRTIDSLFAAVDEFIALLNWEFAKNAKVAMALAVLTWLFPLTVILTPGSLTVAPLTEVKVDRCNDVRTLNFETEKEKNWRNLDSINGYPGLSLSLWNSTKDASTTFTPFNDTFFDYWDQSSSQVELVATHSALSGDVVPRANVAVETCGAGWNCSYTISYVAPGYKCSEVARGRNLDEERLKREHGVPFNASELLPNGDYGYIADAFAGDYVSSQIDAGDVGVPTIGPPFPRNLGAFRTEPVLWVGHSIPTAPGRPPTDRSAPGWDTAFEPAIFRCEHYLANYTVQFNHTFSTQTTTVLSKEFLHPIINTTYLPDRAADDGTKDNTTAIPESNYVLPLDYEKYRVVGAYHSLGLRLRHYVHGKIKYLPYPIVESDVTKTQLISKRSYLPVPGLMDEIQRFYENITLSLLSNPQFMIVSWAADPAERSGVGSSFDPANPARDLSYPCTRTRVANAYAYRKRDLWIAYAVAIAAALACAALGTAALAQNNFHVRDMHVSSIVAATRAPCLDALPWRTDSAWGEVPREVLDTAMGYGLVADGRDGPAMAMAMAMTPRSVGSPETESAATTNPAPTPNCGGGGGGGKVYYGFAQQEVLERTRIATFGQGKPRSRVSAFSFKTWE
ncbi:Formylmethionine deformylase-like protein [Madurella fahalii]|uniref:Formylmethionine deformylase-like protein n=1 Tax=Madurella fahalii TaxID=1157608 RepID=A0ABQ0GLY4_9PEZI